MSQLALIAAVARDGAIGRGNALLWSDPEDMRHFRAETQGCPVVMGRRTWESLPARFRPLPGRRNVVVTRQAGYAAPGAETAPGLDEALARVAAAPRVFVIGGGQLYAEALPRADELVLTEVDAAFPDADTFFPRIPRGLFDEVSREARRAADGTAFAFVHYRRRRAAG
ncbi:MAG: dihydrofolate reductase [Rubrivivax sp.]